MTAMFQTESLCRTFKLPRTRVLGGHASRRALDNINLTVNPGDRLGIVGESGSGKTTLARLLLGLDVPTAGSVRFLGETLPLADMKSFRRQVQAVFQDPRSSLNPRMSVADIVREPLECMNIEEAHSARVDESLEAVGLSKEICARFPHELSGGQRQRVAIARALASRPRLLVADEPVSALDVLIRDEVAAVLSGLTTNLGLTLIIVSHDLKVIARLCDKIFVLHRGVAVEHGTVADVFRSPTHEVTQRLIASVPRMPVARNSP